MRVHGWIPWNGDVETALDTVKRTLRELQKSGMPQTDWEEPITIWGAEREGKQVLFFETS